MWVHSPPVRVRIYSFQDLGFRTDHISGRSQQQDWGKLGFHWMPSSLCATGKLLKTGYDGWRPANLDHERTSKPAVRKMKTGPTQVTLGGPHPYRDTFIGCPASN